jgi:uncharacterized protein with PQ loop repeat
MARSVTTRIARRRRSVERAGRYLYSKRGLSVRWPQKRPRRSAILFPPDLSIHTSGFPAESFLIVFVDILGWIGAVTVASVALPQVVRILRTSATTGISPLTWRLILGVNLAWMTHGVLTHHPNIVVANTLYALSTSTILILLWRHRGIRFWQLFVPGIVLALLVVAVDVFSGPIAFGVVAFIPAALSQLAQLRSLVLSPTTYGVSLWWLAYCVINQGIWFTWSVLAHEISVTIVATGLGTLMTLNLILGVLRRLNVVRAPLPLSDG